MEKSHRKPVSKEWKKPVITQYGTIKKLTKAPGDNKIGGTTPDVFGGFCGGS